MRVRTPPSWAAPITPDLSGDDLEGGLVDRHRVERRKVPRVEHRVVGHDRHRLAVEELVGVGRRARVAEEVEVELVARERSLEGEERAAVERGDLFF